MKRTRIYHSLMRLAASTLVVLALSACGSRPAALVAESRIGAGKPPLPPVETRVPQFSQVFADVAEKVIPVVVSIRSVKVVDVPQFDPFEWFFGSPQDRGSRRSDPRQAPPRQQRIEGIGSGVIVSPDGYIMTNTHVVEEMDDLIVTLSDKREFKAKVVGIDPPSDIAVIKLDNAKGLQAAYLGDSDKLRIGEMVVAVGSPYGLPETVTSGIVSARGRGAGGTINEYENFIQTDAAINPGNSGGALVDLNGAVVGINTAIFSRSGGNQGIGFAIPVNMARQIMDQLISEGKVSRGWLGVSIKNIEGDLAAALGMEPGSGVLVDDVFEDTPAAAAGIKSGDVIVELNGERMAGTTELMNKVAMIKPGARAAFVVLRDGARKTYNVVLGERPARAELAAGGGSAATSEKTGLTVENLNQQNRRDSQVDESVSGVLVTQVEATGPGAQARLEPGDVIVEVDRKPVKSVREFNRAIEAVTDGNALLLVSRAGRSFFTAIRLEEK
ncbi:MAG: DegQ family serine endoprotease [Candidatus Glassbacteria bacterium]|nr:DegQ family serine endoprotease [Candidatus Glassbacteria bacterium]